MHVNFRFKTNKEYMPSLYWLSNIDLNILLKCDKYTNNLLAVKIYIKVLCRKKKKTIKSNLS